MNIIINHFDGIMKTALSLKSLGLITLITQKITQRYFAIVTSNSLCSIVSITMLLGCLTVYYVLH